jgi:hypothetical protein
MSRDQVDVDEFAAEATIRTLRTGVTGVGRQIGKRREVVGREAQVLRVDEPQRMEK